MPAIPGIFVMAYVFGIIGFLYGIYAGGSIVKGIVYGLIGFFLPALLILVLCMIILFGPMVLKVILIMLFFFLLYVASVFWRAFHRVQ